MEAMVLRQLISTGPAELLIASIWQGLLLTVVTWAALKLAPGLRAATRFTLWLTVFLLVGLLPIFAFCSGFIGAHSVSASVAPEAGFSLHLNSGWAFVIEGTWVLASLFSLARLFSSGRHMRALLRESSKVAVLDDEIRSVLTRPGRRSVELRLSDAVDAPSVIGFFRPAVVLPRALWNELAPGELKQIIQHEIAHLDRGDDWTNLLQKLLRAASPLNPALFWAERHLCREREQACDDAVLDAAGNARAYATCLTKLAETRLVRRVTTLAPGLWQRHSELAGRVENILHRRRNLGPVVSGGLVAAGLLASFSGAVVLQRCPGIVTFAGNDPVTTAASVHPSSFDRVPYDSQQARFQEAVFHTPANPTGVRANLQPKGHPKRPAPSLRSLQFVQLTEDQDGGGFTLILFTVELPRNTRVSHGEPRPTPPAPDSWIAFQI